MKANSHYIIVVGIDFEADGTLALDAALSMATQRPGAEIHPVFVDASLAAKGADLGPRTENVADRSEQRLLELGSLVEDRMKATVGTAPEAKPPVLNHFRVGNPAKQLVQLAVDLGADMIVVGTHGRRGVKRFVLGSVAAKVLELARCPVFVVRPKDHENIGELPEIEPPCPDCVTVRAEGKAFWCERHSVTHRVKPHHYHYVYNQAVGSIPKWGAMFD